MKTIKEYAKEKNISYEAVRKQVKRYQNELSDHITTNNKTKYLDEYAIQFLDERRKNNPITIVETEKNEKIEQLEAENKNLLLKVAELQNSLLLEKDIVKQLQDEKIKLIESQNKSFMEKLRDLFK